MSILVTIKRQESPDAKPRWESFDYTGDANLSIADLLRQINAAADLRQSNGSPASRIAWDCSCLEKQCGACAMVVNGNPVLACSVSLRDCIKGDAVTIEPLGKFPVVRDLKVDRSRAFEILRDMGAWVDASREQTPSKDEQLRFQSSECLMCGCCLEVCPNYSFDGKFGGAAALMGAYTAITGESDKKMRRQLGKEYLAHFAYGCGESLACNDVCPAQLPLDKIQARMNKIR